MLHAFTWQQFLVAALIFSLVWLLVVLLLFFRKEVFEFLSGKTPEVEPLKHAWQEEFEEDPGDLMGKASEAEGVSILGQGDFGFVPRDLSYDVPVDSGEILRSELFDLMEDVKPLFQASDLSKAELIGEVNASVRLYPKLLESTLLETFYLMVAEKVGESETLDFKISAEELLSAL
ncbi:hypothetical protein BDD43_2043 [Mucilaginibacter gracilis]|uniref:Uncharacterized protein n=1 Tax=Mucilaginibacter gracilis TaxID=423350 RepID=A0A495IZ96_9SPHI|nr:hypothetical protein [Mucilaginibacter gracilis]RKR81882.1 hypothetical protein BDD43_2043 [Mucilaginibacter gracilis]